MKSLSLNDRPSGKLGELYFSDLLGAALIQKFTGAVFLTVPSGEGSAYFREGLCVHASGSALAAYRLGELLFSRGLKPEQLEAGLKAQQTNKGTPLGELLVQANVCRKLDVSEAAGEQLAKRMGLLIEQNSGTFQVAPGNYSEIDRLAIPLEGWQMVAPLLKQHGSEAELVNLSDQLLGKAVRLTSPAAALRILKPDEFDKQVLELLEKPRKPDQIERALKNRKATRALLKALLVMKYLEQRPSKEGIPIKDALKLSVPSTFIPITQAKTQGVEAEVKTEATPPEAKSEPKPKSVEDSPEARSKKLRKTPAVKELIAFVETAKDRSYFDLLGVDEISGDAEVRKSFTALAKKFHPDTLGQDLPSDIEELARGASAKLNDANATLTDPIRRAEYVALLASGKPVLDESGKQRAQSAKVKYEMGLVHFKKHEYKKGRELFRMAMDMDPHNATYRGWYAWAFFSDPKLDRHEALTSASKYLVEAMEQDEYIAQLHFFWGQVLKAKEDAKGAQKAFERCFDLDPKHTEAEREVRLHKRRSDKDKESKDKGGGLSRFFKR